MNDEYLIKRIISSLNTQIKSANMIINQQKQLKARAEKRLREEKKKLHNLNKLKGE